MATAFSEVKKLSDTKSQQPQADPLLFSATLTPKVAKKSMGDGKLKKSDSATVATDPKILADKSQHPPHIEYCKEIKVNRDDLVRSKQIFHKGQLDSRVQFSVEKIANVRNRLHELYYVLNTYNAERPDIEENIHWVAILACIGRLFEVLNKTRPFKNILTWNFKDSVKRVIYHSRAPFYSTPTGEIIDPRLIIQFFIHCYEHCRNELTPILGQQLPSLAHKIKAADRKKPWFHTVMNMGSIWADDRVKDSEVRSKAIERLASNKVKFLETRKYLKENRNHSQQFWLNT